MVASRLIVPGRSYHPVTPNNNKLYFNPITAGSEYVFFCHIVKYNANNTLSYTRFQTYDYVNLVNGTVNDIAAKINGQTDYMMFD